MSGEDLPVLIDQCHNGDGNVQDVTDVVGQMTKLLLRGSVKKTALAKRANASGLF
ncbi:hypothetical protein GCM10016234_00490 [Tianweitania populi]|uniref:Uncharacterized protein n=1 Tax=Tianweitania populi TaxID=1607949 RepID=A0A8J3DKN1_9HYPH|nr:hypothetical protein GCM10016234_00490 [Tianweitania populi]